MAIITPPIARMDNLLTCVRVASYSSIGDLVLNVTGKQFHLNMFSLVNSTVAYKDNMSCVRNDIRSQHLFH